VGSSNFKETGAAIDVNAYTHVDDLPMNTMTDYLQQVTVSTTSYLQLDMTDPAEWCFNGVQALVSYHSPNGGANSGKSSIFDGTQETVVQSGDVSTSGSLA